MKEYKYFIEFTDVDDEIQEYLADIVAESAYSELEDIECTDDNFDIELSEKGYREFMKDLNNAASYSDTAIEALKHINVYSRVYTITYEDIKIA